MRGGKGGEEEEGRRRSGGGEENKYFQEKINRLPTLQPGREERRRGRRRREEVETVEAELYLLPTTMCFPRISKLERNRVWVCTLGCLPPRGQSENKIRGVHIPPSHDPSN